METHLDHPLTHLNTFRVSARAECYLRFDHLDEVTAFLAAEDIGKGPYLILGGGSNLLFAGDVDGTVLHPDLKGIEILGRDGDHIRVRAQAGEVWDDLVALAVAEGWGGIENLSLIPGSVGASAIQNIGAYGVEVKSVIERVEALTLPEGNPVSFGADACGFAYRDSVFKRRRPARHLITAIVFRLQSSPRFELAYAGVRACLEQIGPPTLANIRRAIIELRQQKLPDPAILGNAGSFFKNPTVTTATLNKLRQDHPDLPHYPHEEGGHKLAAGWLIDRCGWKGKARGAAAVHDRQALVLVNRGGASGAEILNLAQEIAGSVAARFGIDLEREVRVVGGGAR
jgi:UDP-N-acetylmuramate dehydrogenase